MELEYIIARAAMQEGDVHRIRCIRTLVKQAGGFVGKSPLCGVLELMIELAWLARM